MRPAAAGPKLLLLPFVVGAVWLLLLFVGSATVAALGLDGLVLTVYSLVAAALAVAGAVRARRIETSDAARARRRLDDRLDQWPAVRTETYSPSTGATALELYDEDREHYDDAQRRRVWTTISSATNGPNDHERVLDQSTLDAETFVAHAAEADSGPTLRRFARTDPDLVEPHLDHLLESAADGSLAAILAVADVGTAFPEHAEEIVDRLGDHHEADSARVRGYTAAALGQLSQHDRGGAGGSLTIFAEERDPDVRAVATRALEGDWAGGDEFDATEEARAQFASDTGGSRSGTAPSAGSNAGSSTDSSGSRGGFNGDYTYDCEGCGATLWDEMDMTTNPYSCVTCGHRLDDQDGARKVYLNG